MDTQSIALLRDRASQVTVNPSAPHCWRRLEESLVESDDPALCRATLQSLLAATPQEGVAGFLRATFLFARSGEWRFLADAARALHSIEPPGADRIMAFLALSWTLALTHSASRAEFLTKLREADLPALLTRLGGQINATTRPPSQRDITAIRRVALFTPHMGNADHALTALALNHARLLRDAGIEVRLFTCQESDVPDFSQWFGADIRFDFPRPDPASWHHFAPENLEVSFSYPQFSLMQRWHEKLAEIAAYDPDLVFCVGFYSPLLFPLYKRWPVVGLSGHTLPPIAPVDVWLAGDKEESGKIEETWAPRIPPCEAAYYPYRIALKPDATPVSRESLGLGPDNLALVSVGDRLQQEIPSGWAARLAEFLRRHPDTHWLLVGGSGQLPPALAAAAGQIRGLPHHDEVRALLGCCDIALNPPRMGGGFSIAMAMAAGLPVVSLGGSDGGDKIGDAAVADDDAYFARLERLVGDAELRRREGENMRRCFAETLDLAQAGPSLLAACETALTRFHKRINPTLS